MKINNTKCDIFISYRRKDGWELARLIYLYLAENDYKVFFDIERLFNGEFPKGLENNLSTCEIFIPILTRDSLERCVTEKDDWVKKEYLEAIRLNKIIIPIKDKSFKLPEGLPQEIIDLCDETKYGKGNEKRPIFIKTSKDTFENDILKINEILIKTFKQKDFSDENEKTEKIDSPLILREEVAKAKRMSKEEIQEISYFVQGTGYSQIYSPLNDAIWNIRDKIQDAKILDLSTGYGYFEKQFITNNKCNISHLYNIDPNPDSVEVKKQIFLNNENVSILNWFPNEKSFLTDLQSLKTKFDIVLIVDILNKFKDPESIIASIKEVMSDNGIIIIWQQDFGLSFTYPDWNSQLKEFNNILNQSDCVGNKSTGREVFTYLHKLGFKNIHFDLIISPCDQDEKEMMFDKKFYDLKQFLLNDKNNQWTAEIKWLDEEKKNLKKKYCANKAFNSESFFIWIAKKGN